MTDVEKILKKDELLYKRRKNMLIENINKYKQNSEMFKYEIPNIYKPRNIINNFQNYKHNTSLIKKNKIILPKINNYSNATSNKLTNPSTKKISSTSKKYFEETDKLLITGGSSYYNQIKSIDNKNIHDISEIINLNNPTRFNSDLKKSNSNELLNNKLFIDRILATYEKKPTKFQIKLENLYGLNKDFKEQIINIRKKKKLLSLENYQDNLLMLVNGKFEHKNMNRYLKKEDEIRNLNNRVKCNSPINWKPIIKDINEYFKMERSKSYEKIIEKLEPLEMKNKSKSIIKPKFSRLSKLSVLLPPYVLDKLKSIYE